MGIAGLAALFADLGLTTEEKLGVAAELRDRYVSEFGCGEGLSRQLAARYRAERAQLEGLATSSMDPNHPLAAGFEILAARSRRVAPLLRELVWLRSTGRLDHPVEDLLASFAHMWMNRLTRSAGRAHELVMFDFLARAYRSTVARAERTASEATLVL